MLICPYCNCRMERIQVGSSRNPKGYDLRWERSIKGYHYSKLSINEPVIPYKEPRAHLYCGACGSDIKGIRYLLQIKETIVEHYVIKDEAEMEELL